MKKIWILGAGGFAVEVYSWLRDHLASTKDGEFAGFIDDFCPESGILNRIGDASERTATVKVDDFEPAENDWCVCALGQPSAKADMLPKLAARGVRFLTLIHPTAIIGANVEIGEGSVICPRVILSGCNRLGRFSSLNFFSSMSHDAVCGDYCTINPYAAVSGKCRLGDRVTVGSHAAIHPGVSIGDDVIVGIGSVVVNRIRGGKTVFGIPAVAIGARR